MRIVPYYEMMDIRTGLEFAAAVTVLIIKFYITINTI
jgi:hypothetical protein